jgi:hypothetical protein
LHSLALARHTTKRRGEIDFVLLSGKGIFVLEVKGGRISREGGVWRFADRYGAITEKSESPFDQAGGAMFALEEDIRRHFHNDDRFSRLLFGFGVMFPDIVFNVTGTEADYRQVYDARDRREPITRFVDRLAAYWRECDSYNRFAPTEKHIETLVDFLRGDFDLVPPLTIQAEAIAEQILSLEKEQYAVLDTLDHLPRPRIIIQGGAGTGKTLLAVEATKREARKPGSDVLLLCYNRLLATFLESKLNTGIREGGKVTVRSIYSLLNEVIESSSLAKAFKRKCEMADQTTIYRKLFPEYSILALIETKVTPFRTLIVDEAQDIMKQELLDALDYFVEGGLEAGHWCFFCDTNNQASVFGIFDRAALFRLMSFGQVIILPTNRRNTKPIAEETAMLSLPAVRSTAIVDGIPVRYGWFEKPDAQSSALTRILRQLLSEGIAPSRITVLSPRKAEDCCASSVTEPPVVLLDEQNIWEVATGLCHSISYCSVSSFKGLENDFIVLTDIENLDSGWWKSVMYVGMSRARIGLYLLLNQTLKAPYEERLRSWIREHDIPAEQLA